MDDKGQMMVLEVIIFAILIIIALIFLYQLSPPDTVTNIYSVELKIQGDSALQDLCNDNPSEENLPDNYPLNSLSHYIVTNDYNNLTLVLEDLLPADVMYNIWICNETKAMFWVNSSYNDYGTKINAEALETVGSVTTSNCMIAISPAFINNTNDILLDQYHQGRYYNDKCDLSNKFDKYNASTYNLILEMWET